MPIEFHRTNVFIYSNCSFMTDVALTVPVLSTDQEQTRWRFIFSSLVSFYLCIFEGEWVEGSIQRKRITLIAISGQLLNKCPVKTLFDEAKRQWSKNAIAWYWLEKNQAVFSSWRSSSFKSACCSALDAQNGECNSITPSRFPSPLALGFNWYTEEY